MILYHKEFDYQFYWELAVYYKNCFYGRFIEPKVIGLEVLKKATTDDSRFIRAELFVEVDDGCGSYWKDKVSFKVYW